MYFISGNKTQFAARSKNKYSLHISELMENKQLLHPEAKTSSALNFLSISPFG